MKKFYLHTLLKIFGVGAASGITYMAENIQVISDDSNYLYSYNIPADKLDKILLQHNEVLEQRPKSDKLDFEAMLETEKGWYVFGSGSTSGRERGFFVQRDHQKTDTLQLRNLYQSMRDFAEIKEEDFNIEGVARNKTDWFFLNRGNGPANKNVIFTVQGKNLEDEFNLFYNDFTLPKINGVPTGFSDAVIVKNKLFFIATAENAASTYQDGAVEGTLFGCINLKKMEMEFVDILSDNQKFEGITVYEQTSGKEISFLLCEDNDDKNPESTIYRLDVQLKKRLK